MSPVYRAPMRSRRVGVDPYAGVERALQQGLCGMGEVTDERSARRLERFGAVEEGAFVWTRDADGLAYLGRLTGACRRDLVEEAAQVDLVHVRDCVWSPDPVPDADVPPAVSRTFERGGLNFQQIHDPAVEEQSASLWDEAPGSFR